MGLLPPHNVREHALAKSIRLTVSERAGVVVTVPKGFDRSRLTEILLPERTRLEEMWHWLQHRRRERKPERIRLQAIGEDWSVEYRPTASRRVIAIERGVERLIVTGAVDDGRACSMALRRWMSRKAHVALVPWLKQTSAEYAIELSTIRIGAQRTLWASCTADKTMSINQKLLFLPAHLVRYVFVHELSHTVHLHHGKQFWELVGSYEPNHSALRREMRSAFKLVPAWWWLAQRERKRRRTKSASRGRDGH